MMYLFFPSLINHIALVLPFNQFEATDINRSIYGFVVCSNELLSTLQGSEVTDVRYHGPPSALLKLVNVNADQFTSQYTIQFTKVYCHQGLESMSCSRTVASSCK